MEIYIIFIIIFIVVITVLVLLHLDETKHSRKILEYNNLNYNYNKNNMNMNRLSGAPLKSFDPNNLEGYNKTLKNDSRVKLLRNSITNNNVDSIFLDRDNIQKLNHAFTNKLKTNTKITDQKQTGRCWIFSFLNMIRIDLIKDMSLPGDFEFSENYLFLYDKLEKSKYFLQNIFQTKNQSVESRTVTYLLNNAVEDGGTWNMAVNLINKYGVIPKSVMRETFHSGNSRRLNFFLTENLKMIAYQIRESNIDNIEDFIEHKMKDIYKLLVLFLGIPPTHFDWEYTVDTSSDKFKKSKKSKSKEDDKNIKKRINNLTPKVFTEKYLKFNSDEWVLCCNFPSDEYKYYNVYDIRYCNNMIDGEKTKMFNLPIDYIIDFTRKSIDSEQSVWFACDYSKYLSTKHSILSTKTYDYSDLYSNKLAKYDKKINLKYKISVPNHAMLFIGYDKNHNNKVDKWLVENSHGDGNGRSENINYKGAEENGYITMTTDWFKDYVYEVVVKKTLLPSNLRKMLNKNPIVLNPWDCIGCQVAK